MIGLLIIITAILSIGMVACGILLWILLTTVMNHTRAIQLINETSGDIDKTLEINQKHLAAHSKDILGYQSRLEGVQRHVRALEREVGPCTCSMDPQAPHPEADCPMHGM
jgi:hypothetical protein